MVAGATSGPGPSGQPKKLIILPIILVFNYLLSLLLILAFNYFSILFI